MVVRGSSLKFLRYSFRFSLLVSAFYVPAYLWTKDYNNLSLALIGGLPYGVYLVHRWYMWIKAGKQEIVFLRED